MIQLKSYRKNKIEMTKLESRKEEPTEIEDSNENDLTVGFDRFVKLFAFLRHAI